MPLRAHMRADVNTHHDSLFTHFLDGFFDIIWRKIKREIVSQSQAEALT